MPSISNSPSHILELFTAHWTTAILASAVDLEIFEQLEHDSRTLEELSETTSLPARSLQALLDGLVVAKLVTITDGVRYRNTESASAHLVAGKPGYLGNFAKILVSGGDGGIRQWSTLSDAVRSGRPSAPETIVAPDHPFWPDLVRALSPVSREVASIAADLVDLKLRQQPLSALDVGGGAGAYALEWLPRNTLLRVKQIDWAPVNALAREAVNAANLGERFTTLDGDLHHVPFGTKNFDIVIVSNICHHESPRGNVALFEKIAEALVPGGQIVVSDFVLYDDRSGPDFAARFGAGMVLQTPEGQSYRECDYQTWLGEAGFGRANVDRSHPLSTLLIANNEARA